MGASTGASTSKPRLGTAALPTLPWGERDALFGQGNQRRLLEALPNARLTIYPNTGHCPTSERPERVATDLTAFVQRM
jgi:pimeloyl-ACP methyl ester carboxylesterase